MEKIKFKSESKFAWKGNTHYGSLFHQQNLYVCRSFAVPSGSYPYSCPYSCPASAGEGAKPLQVNGR